MKSRAELNQDILDAVEEYKQGFVRLLQESDSVDLFSSAEITGQCLHDFLQAVTHFESDVLLFSMGSYMGPDTDTDAPEDQQVPPYILNFAETKKTQIMLMDMQFSQLNTVLDEQPFLSMDGVAFEQIPSEHLSAHFKSTSHPNLKLSTFGQFMLPYEYSPKSWDMMHAALNRILANGGKVFIASHLNIYDLSFAPALIPIYNDLKDRYGTAVQLYIQASGASVCRYGDHPYVERDIDAFLDDVEEDYSIERLSELYQDFDVCPSIKDLSDYDAFQVTQPFVTATYKTTLRQLNPEEITPVIKKDSRLTR